MIEKFEVGKKYHRPGAGVYGKMVFECLYVTPNGKGVLKGNLYENLYWPDKYWVEHKEMKTEKRKLWWLKSKVNGRVTTITSEVNECEDEVIRRYRKLATHWNRDRETECIAGAWEVIGTSIQKIEHEVK